MEWSSNGPVFILILAGNLLFILPLCWLQDDSLNPFNPPMMFRHLNRRKLSLFSFPNSISAFLKVSFVLFLIVGSSAILASCKEDDHHHDHYEADIEFMEPAVGAIIASGDEVHMEVRFTSEGTIHNVKVRIVRQSDQSEVFLWEEHVHEESGTYDFHEHVILTTSVPEDYTIEASTWDHETESDTISLTRSFLLQP